MKVANIQKELQEMVDLKHKTEQGEQKPYASETYEEALAKLKKQRPSGCPEYCVMSNCSNCPNHPIIVKQKPADKIEPKFKIGNTITDPTDSTFIFHINAIKDGKYMESDKEWVMIKEADSDYELVEQKPVSEDLEEEIKRYIEPLSPEDIKAAPFCSIEDCARHFAEWQKKQFEKNRLKHCDSITEKQYNLEQGFIDQHLDKNNRMPTFLDAIEYGMEKMKQQMMKDATEVTVHIDAGGYPYTPEIELYDYDKDMPLAKEGDKYKVILIRED